MLCDSCLLYFDFRRQDYTAIKQETISLLRDLDAYASLIQTLETDQERYRVARSQASGQDDLCPWLSLESFDPMILSEAQSALEEPELEMHGWKVSKTFARSGCEMCSRILEAVNCIGFDPKTTTAESWLVLEPITLRPLHFKIQLEEASLEFDYINIHIFESHQSTIGSVESSTAHGSNSSSFIDELISRLHKCVSNHQKCRDRYDKDWLPSRLVDVQKFTTDGIVRIVRRDEILSTLNCQVNYAALSHVWGTHPFLTLTTSNMAELESGFPISQFSRTFRDAMEITSRMGLRYIWIDSLNIIQDSEADWSAEAGLMDKIYSNSYCTIASSLATSPEQGLFWARNPTFAESFDVEFLSNASASPFKAFLDLQPLVLEYAPLYKRAWVLQESHLSPRTMHFSHFPAFECRECFSCEAYHSRLREEVVPAEAQQFQTTKTLFEDASFPYARWFIIVHEYSRCQLTRATDKLIALNGISEVLATMIPGTYHAGVWSEWWMLGLLWSIDQWLSGYEINSERLEIPNVAPTWSWASVDGPIMPWPSNFLIKDELADLVSFSTTQTPTKRFIDQRVIVRARLFRLPNFNSLVDIDRGELVSYCFSLDHLGVAGDNDTFFAPLANAPGYSSPKTFAIAGLLLQSATGGTGRQRMFQRVGFAVVSHIDGNVAGSGICVENWEQLPWNSPRLEEVVIV